MWRLSDIDHKNGNTTPSWATCSNIMLVDRGFVLRIRDPVCLKSNRFCSQPPQSLGKHREADFRPQWPLSIAGIPNRMWDRVAWGSGAREWMRMSTRTRRIGRTAGTMTVNCKDLPGQYINKYYKNKPSTSGKQCWSGGWRSGKARKRLKELSFPAMKLSALAIEKKKL